MVTALGSERSSSASTRNKSFFTRKLGLALRGFFFDEKNEKALMDDTPLFCHGLAACVPASPYPRGLCAGGPRQGHSRAQPQRVGWDALKNARLPWVVS